MRGVQGCMKEYAYLGRFLIPIGNARNWSATYRYFNNFQLHSQLEQGSSSRLYVDLEVQNPFTQTQKSNITLLPTLCVFSLSTLKLADLLLRIFEHLLIPIYTNKFSKYWHAGFRNYPLNLVYFHFIWILRSGILPLFLPHKLLFKFSFFRQAPETSVQILRHEANEQNNETFQLCQIKSSWHENSITYCQGRLRGYLFLLLQNVQIKVFLIVAANKVSLKSLAQKTVGQFGGNLEMTWLSLEAPLTIHKCNSFIYVTCVLNSTFSPLLDLSAFQVLMSPCKICHMSGSHLWRQWSYSN